MKNNLFVTFEGIEGCGKTTQLKLLAEWLRARRHHVCETREPGGTPFGIEIRKILLSEKNSHLTSISEALLYMADRFQHIVEVIQPALKKGEIVLCDRYHDSTVAYQGYARKIPLEFLDSIWKNSGNSLEPDLTILLDLDPETGIERSMRKLAMQKLDESRFEKEHLDFHRSVRLGFLALQKQYPERIRSIDANRPVEEIHQDVIRLMGEKLEVE